MEWYHVYLFVKLDDIAKFVEATTILFILVSIFLTFITIYRLSGLKMPLGKAIIPQLLCIIFTVFIGIVGALLPSTKQIAAIYLIPKIVNNEKVQAISGNAMDIVNNKFAEWVQGSKKSLPNLVEETKKSLPNLVEETKKTVEKEIKK